MKTLVDRLDETEASLSDATSDKKALADKIDALQAANTNLKGEVSNAQADVAQSKNNQAEMLARVNQLMERLDEKDTALVDLRGAKAELEAAVKNAQSLNERFESEIKDLTDERAKLKWRMVQSDRALVKVAKQKETAEKERDALAKEKADLEEVLKREADAAKESLAHQVEETESLKIRLRDKEEALTIAASNMSQEVASAKEAYDEQVEKTENLQRRLDEMEHSLSAVTKDKDDMSVMESQLIQERDELEKKLEHASSSKYRHCVRLYYCKLL